MSKTILFLAANPINTPRLRLENEKRRIDEVLRMSKFRDNFNFVPVTAARFEDFRRAMLEHNPEIVHFCGHSSVQDGISLEDDNGYLQNLSSDSLSLFFQLFKDKVECVVLNACYTEAQARGIAKFIPYVIGMQSAIEDSHAIEFAKVFYEALGAGRSYEFSQEMASVSLIHEFGVSRDLSALMVSIKPWGRFNSKTIQYPAAADPIDSPFYIERAADTILRDSIINGSGTLSFIRSGRQTGKTSLLMRLVHVAKQYHQRVILLDFEVGLIGQGETFSEFLKHLAYKAADQMDLEIHHVDKIWDSGRYCTDKFDEFFRKYILSRDEKTFLAIDEAESLLNVDYGIEFFQLIRKWRNSAGAFQEFMNLNIVIVVSTHPKLNLAALYRSPAFNAGESLYLPDFNLNQVADLNHRHGKPLKDGELSTFIQWLGGHPFLIRLGLYHLVKYSKTWDMLIPELSLDNGPFGEHLNYYRKILQNDHRLVKAYLGALKGLPIKHSLILESLASAGLLKDGKTGIEPRCGLYSVYFQEKFT